MELKKYVLSAVLVGISAIPVLYAKKADENGNGCIRKPLEKTIDRSLPSPSLYVVTEEGGRGCTDRDRPDFGRPDFGGGSISPEKPFACVALRYCPGISPNGEVPGGRGPFKPNKQVLRYKNLEEMAIWPPDNPYLDRYNEGDRDYWKEHILEKRLSVRPKPPCRHCPPYRQPWRPIEIPVRPPCANPLS